MIARESRPADPGRQDTMVGIAPAVAAQPAATKLPQPPQSWQCVVEKGQPWRTPAGNEVIVAHVDKLRTDARVFFVGWPEFRMASHLCGPNGWERLPDAERPCGS